MPSRNTLVAPASLIVFKQPAGEYVEGALEGGLPAQNDAAMLDVSGEIEAKPVGLFDQAGGRLVETEVYAPLAFVGAFGQEMEAERGFASARFCDEDV